MAHLGIQPSEFWNLTLVEFHSVYFAKNPKNVIRAYEGNFWSEEDKKAIEEMKARENQKNNKYPHPPFLRGKIK